MHDLPENKSHPADWPDDLQRAYEMSLADKQYRELRYLLWTGLAITFGSLVVDFVALREEFVMMVALRLVVVLPLQVAALLMPPRLLTLQKLLAGLAIIAFAGVLLVGSQWASAPTAAYLAMGPILLLGVAGPTLPFSPRELAVFIGGFGAMFFAMLFFTESTVLQNPAFVTIALITLLVSFLLPRRMWVLQGHNFLLSLKAERRLQSLADSNVELEELSRQDPLTGLANRRHVKDVFSSHYDSAPGAGGERAAILMLDIDRFKQFNDRWGHHAGDECLRAVAEALRHAAIRHSGLAARLGGEEFLLLLRANSPRRAFEVAEELRLAIERIEIELPQRGESASCTTSIGVAVHDGHDVPDLSELLRSADQALYAAKRGGRNRSELATA